ncbi:hypothetical protein QTP88_019027 [Uroleucon formosanum]
MFILTKIKYIRTYRTGLMYRQIRHLHTVPRILALIGAMPFESIILVVKKKKIYLFILKYVNFISNNYSVLCKPPLCILKQEYRNYGVCNTVYVRPRSGQLSPKPRKVYFVDLILAQTMNNKYEWVVYIPHSVQLVQVKFIDY